MTHDHDSHAPSANLGRAFAFGIALNLAFVVLEAVYGLIADCIAQANCEFAAEPNLAAAQIHKFLILHKELDADDGELTRTRKVRRRIIAERYRTLIDALYSVADSGHIETEVTFEDGRKGVLRADLAIRAAATVPVDLQALARAAAIREEAAA